MAMSECGQKRPLPELEKIEKPRKRAKISDEPPDPTDIPQLESALFYKFDQIGLGFKILLFKRILVMRNSFFLILKTH